MFCNIFVSKLNKCDKEKGADGLCSQIEMKRIVNKRPLCFAAAMLSVGIVLGLLAVDNIISRIVLISLFFALTVTFAFIKKLKRIFYLPLAIMVGAVSFYGAHDLYIAKSVNENDTVYFATVASEILVEDDTTSFKIKNIYLNGEKLGGTARIYLSSASAPEFSAGDEVEIRGNLKSSEFNALDSYFASAFSLRNTKVGFAQQVKLMTEKQPDFMLGLEMKLKRAFYQNTKDDTASICISLIYGDKNGINQSLYDDIKLSGLAHMLAVSGSHITILAAAIAFLLNKLKVNKKLSGAIVIVLLFFYSLFCGFSPSVTRAFIMSTIFLLSATFGKKFDPLSTLSLTAILILIFQPVDLFEIGFQLSFASVLGILLFYRSFNQVFRKTGKVFSPIISTTLAANITTYPIMAQYFTVFPVFSLISNIIILPLFTFLFVLLLIFAVFVLIFPFPTILLIFDYLMIPLKAFFLAVGSLKVSGIPILPLGIMSVAYYFDVIVLSRFVFLKMRTKIALTSTFTAVCLVVALSI